MYDFNLPTQFGEAKIRIGLPPSYLINFPPSSLPETIPAPHVDVPTWKQPFNIPHSLYNQVLDVRVPITIASVYAVTVVLINRINKSRGYKPYAFSQSPIFKLFVILHNVFLAVYSAWTFVGMFQAFTNSFPERDDPNGWVAFVDSMCKINGPRGYGNAATYSPVTAQWSIANPTYKLSNGLPDSTDVGRLWNQGLAYFGWIFYLSKFYEVVDTAIILAKGKKSSTLQTYHHAGAMMCMWAGIRYMAAPIWIFALVNSAIHALMYSYYTLTALRIRVPNAVKRSLTTMQITQFILGTNMAAAYLFFEYTIPVLGNNVLSKAVPAAAADDVGVAPWLKKMAFRAAGADGIAGNVGNPDAVPVTGNAQRMITCMDTTGQAFAIWLNVAYLLPLTYLFGRFFVRSYLKRKDPNPPTHMEAAEKAGMDALRGLGREIQKTTVEGENSEGTTDDEVVNASVQNVADEGLVQNSPIRTRSSAANKAKATAQASSTEGFSSVSVKKGAKKQTKKDLESSDMLTAHNPYEVLDRNS